MSCAPPPAARSPPGNAPAASAPPPCPARPRPSAFAVERASRKAHTDAATLDRTTAAALERRRRDLDRILGTLAAHDPQRTLERGYALLEDESGEPITSAAAAREQPSLTIRLHDGRIQARPETAEDAPRKRETMSAADAVEDDGPRLF